MRRGMKHKQSKQKTHTAGLTTDKFKILRNLGRETGGRGEAETENNMTNL
jgi:hypothetical protein